MPQAQHHAEHSRATHGAGPYEVRVDGARMTSFGDMRDAISAAKIAKRERMGSVVGVQDATTGQFVEVDG
jgi:hypothetical protein